MKVTPIATVCLLSVTATLAGCGSEGPDACVPENHCDHGSDGVSRCEDGYTWQDEDDPDNFTCVKEPEAPIDCPAYEVPNAANDACYCDHDYIRKGGVCVLYTDEFNWCCSCLTTNTSTSGAFDCFEGPKSQCVGALELGSSITVIDAGHCLGQVCAADCWFLQ